MTREQALTPAQVHTIGELREAGVTHSEIARRLEVSVYTVEWCCLKLGIFPPEGPIKRRIPSKVMQRNGRQVRPFTQAEDRRLLELEAQGLRHFEIARALGRRQNSVLARLRTLARWETHREAP